MKTADAYRAARQCEIVALAEAVVDPDAVQLRAAALERGLDARFRLVDRGAVGGLVLRGQANDLFGRLRDLAVLTSEIADPRGLERGVIRAGGDLRHRAVRDLLQVLWSRHSLSK